jgi:phosphoglycolate phosphatase
MGYRFVLWDFDGTLADSLAYLVRVYNGVAQQHGFRPVEDPEALRGLTLLPLLRRQNIPLRKLPALVRAVLAAQRAEITSVPLFPGIPEVLHELRDAGVRMAVLSSNSRENIWLCLRARRVAEFFEDVIGYRRLFGKASSIRRFVRRQWLATQDVVYVGDEVRDIDAARRAGVSIASVTWGFNTAELLAEHRPDYLIERSRQLLAVIHP